VKHRAKTIKPICLIILDGWGLSTQIEGNAIRLAKTPHMDNYFNIYTNTRLDASGEAEDFRKVKWEIQK